MHHPRFEPMTPEGHDMLIYMTKLLKDRNLSQEVEHIGPKLHLLRYSRDSSGVATTDATGGSNRTTRKRGEPAHQPQNSDPSSHTES